MGSQIATLAALHGIAVRLQDVSEAQLDKSGDPAYQPSPRLKEKVEKGELGRKTGRGWYRYEDGN